MATSADRSRGRAPDRSEELDLSDSVQLLLEECRTVLPGIQALFGFQLIAVLSEGFSTKLARWQQDLHLAALLLVTVSIAFVMAPTSLNRQAERGRATDRFVHVASRLLLAAMAPLALGICFEVFLVADVICHSVPVAVGLAAGLLAVFAALWLVYPAWYRARRAEAGKRAGPRAR
jgi:hypothetical protein